MTPPSAEHAAAAISGVQPFVLADGSALGAALTAALSGAGAGEPAVEVVEAHGVTVLALLPDAHATVRTWPARGTAHLDVTSAGGPLDPARAVELFAAAVGGTAPVAAGPAVVEDIAPGLTRRWRLGAVHHDARTPYQRVLVAETAHGTTLFCDDERQSAEATQEVYHEALFLPAALLASRRERVLVIGSSEGVVSRLAVAAGAWLVDHVDIDADCVRLCAELLPYGYSPAELAAAERHEGPVRMHYADGVAYVEECTERYDVVVVDLPDECPGEPDAQLNRLYTTGFLRRCAALLTEGGVVVSQAGSPAMWRHATLRAAAERFGEVFGQVVAYVSDEHEWAFLSGRSVAGPDPAGEMADRLGTLGWRPASLDATALRARSVLPFSLRAR